MNEEELLKKAIDLEGLEKEEVLWLYKNASLPSLMFAANEIRKKKVTSGVVTWIIDRNVNITNVCVSQCLFCNFYRKPDEEGGFITSIESYKKKIDELFKLGGRQLLLQGALHPKLGLDYYLDLFSTLKSLFPELKLHALSPPEIVYIARKEKMSYEEVLKKLIAAGLDSLPGGGAEILCDRVRDDVSPAKAKTSDWLDVMRTAHKFGLITTATMMFGHLETLEERIEHLFRIREVQDERPAGTAGFIAFIPWPFQLMDTRLFAKHPELVASPPVEYVRLLAVSRIVLTNIINIQASWLTVGKETAQLCLHAGANDFGSVMIEENVVSSAGADHKFDVQGIQDAIREAGFTPVLRDQEYKPAGYL